MSPSRLQSNIRPTATLPTFKGNTPRSIDPTLLGPRHPSRKTFLVKFSWDWLVRKLTVYIADGDRRATCGVWTTATPVQSPSTSKTHQCLDEEDNDCISESNLLMRNVHMR